jgi:hypothetical protein
MKKIAKLIMLAAVLTTAEFTVTTAEAATIIWHWAGEVTGYSGDPFGGPSLESVVPLGTPVSVKLSFDPGAPYLNPSSCLQGMGSLSLEVLGRTYPGGGYVWVDGMGFGGGICSSSLDHVEVVAPVWGGNVGPALPGGWIPTQSDSYLPGIWWPGDLEDGQPALIGSQFPKFYIPGQARSQRFTATLHAVPDVETVSAPEPATWILMSTGLAAVWRRRRRQT